MRSRPPSSDRRGLHQGFDVVAILNPVGCALQSDEVVFADDSDGRECGVRENSRSLTETLEGHLHLGEDVDTCGWASENEALKGCVGGWRIS